jgi:hypothetical protein
MEEINKSKKKLFQPHKLIRLPLTIKLMLQDTAIKERHKHRVAHIWELTANNQDRTATS